MKKTFTIIMATLMMAACDKVNVADRLIYVEPAASNKAVLIEDFTGQLCVNCPKAIEEIERLQKEYGDTAVIAVGIHSGPFGKSRRGVPTPLYTSTGDTYFEHWQLEAQPIGVIDRLGAYEYNTWSSGVRQLLQQKPTVAINLSTLPAGTDSTYTASVELIGLDSTAVAGKLQLWIVEDSIDSYQMMPDGSTQEHFNHMHVFRASVNDIWGDDVTLKRGEVKSLSYNFTISKAWVASHCSVVAFVYNDKGVKQVKKKHIKQ